MKLSVDKMWALGLEKRLKMDCERNALLARLASNAILRMHRYSLSSHDTYCIN